MNLIPEEILDKIRQIANQFPNGGLEGDEVYFEIWTESNACDKCGSHDFIYIKSLNKNDILKCLNKLKKARVYPFHLLKIKKVIWNEYKQDWNDDEPFQFQSAEEIAEEIYENRGEK